MNCTYVTYCRAFLVDTPIQATQALTRGAAPDCAYPSLPPFHTHHPAHIYTTYPTFHF